jgi:N-acetylglucosamine-6-phosphate deacetylase
VTVDFILDGEHVDPVAVRMALQCKGPGGVCLVTDANIGAGLPPGVYDGVGGEVEFAYEGAPARMTASSAMPGCLAGSGLTMDRALRNAVKLAGVDLVQAARMAGTNPAGVIGLESETGSIDRGKRADLVLLDRSLEVEATWVGGDLVYHRGRESTGGGANA